MPRRERHQWVRCPTCQGSIEPGKLWIGGGDYVDCPDCVGTPGRVELVETLVEPGKSVFMPAPKHTDPTRILVPWRT